MGSVQSRHRSKEQNQRLLKSIEEANLMKILKCIKKGADITSNVFPGLPPSKISRIPQVSFPGANSAEPPLWSALMHACYRGHNDIVQILLQQGAPLSLKSLDGTTALMIAAQEGHVHVVEELLKHIYRTKEDKMTGTIPVPLENPGPKEMLERKTKEVGAALGTDASETKKKAGASASTSSASAASSSNSAAAELSASSSSSSSSFLSQSGDLLPVVPRSASCFDPILDAIDSKGQTALLKAAALGHAAIVELLVRAGANVCIADQIDGMTALAWAAESGPSEIVLMLIQAGANINRKNYNGQTPLLCAASKDYNYQHINPADMNSALNGIGPSSAAVVTASSSTISSSSSPIAIISSTASYRPRTASTSSSSSPSSVVLTLLSHGADVHAHNHDKYTALMVSAWRGHASVVELLLKFGANVDARAEKGQTALMLATTQCHSRIAELIISAGAKLDLVDEKGESALLKSCASGDAYTAGALIVAGANLNLTEHRQGLTALHIAAQRSHSAIVELLIAKGAAVDTRSHHGHTPLQLCALRGASANTAARLIAGGADLRMTDDEGNTPFMLACRSGCESIVELLLEVFENESSSYSSSGAIGSVTTPSSHGSFGSSFGITPPWATRNNLEEDALTIAMKCSHWRIVELLIAAGASQPTTSSPDDVLVTKRTALEQARAQLEIDTINKGLTKRDAFQLRIRRYADVIEARRNTFAKAAAAAAALVNSPQDHQENLGLFNSAALVVPKTPSQQRRESRNGFSVDTTITPMQLPAASVGSALSGPSSLTFSSSSSLPLLRDWSVNHVLQWLEAIALPQYASLFSEASVDGEMLAELVERGEEGEQLMINELKMERKIHRMKIIREIKKLLPQNQPFTNSTQLTGVTAQAYHALTGPNSSNSSGGDLNGLSHSLPISHAHIKLNGLNGTGTATASSSTAVNATTSTVPLTTSASNPLPSASTNLSKTSSANGLGSSADAVTAASSAKVPASGTELLAPSNSVLALFSPNFDFSDLSNLAPLTMKKANSTSKTASGGSISLGVVTSLNGSPSGSAHSLVNDRPLDNQSLVLVKQQSVSDHYVSMKESDLVDLKKQHRPSEISVNGALSNINDTPSAASKSNSKPQPHAARRIPYRELHFKHVIGQGMYGTVYLGTWRGVAVAIKKLHVPSAALKNSNPMPLANGFPAATIFPPNHMNHVGSSSSNTSTVSAATITAFESNQIELFLQEAALMELLGNHPNLIAFVGIAMPDPRDASSSTALTSGSDGNSDRRGELCIITQYFPLGSIRDLLISKKTFLQLPNPVLQAVSILPSADGGRISTQKSGAAPPLAQCPLSLLTLLHMMHDIACGIYHLHLEHIIHRDIAARNCLVDEFSLAVRVSDYGLSRFLQASSSSDSADPSAGFTHSNVGPLKWMASESVLHHEYSEKSDAYAFGITVWEIIFASDPYPNHLPLEAAILASQNEKFRPVIPTQSCPTPLVQLMQTCWAHDAARRPTFLWILQSIEKMEAFLRERIFAWIKTKKAPPAPASEYDNTALVSTSSSSSSSSSSSLSSHIELSKDEKVQLWNYQWSEECWNSFPVVAMANSSSTSESSSSSSIPANSSSSASVSSLPISMN